VWAGGLAATYTPELDVKGVVAGAPPGDLPSLLSAPVDQPQPYLGFIPMIVRGYEEGYPDLDTSTLLTPAGMDAVAQVGSQCVGEIIGEFAGQAPTSLLTANPNDDPGFGPLLVENSAGRPTEIPLFVYHGEADDVVAPASSAVMTERYCAAGVTVQRRTYPGADHGSVVAVAASDIQTWMRDRLAGTPAPSTC
jgi:pimeloyl-ACP methyl ester carboxylesterase